MKVKGIWSVESIHARAYVVELPDGKVKGFNFTPQRKITEGDLIFDFPGLAALPEGAKRLKLPEACAVPEYIYRFYGIELDK